MKVFLKYLLPSRFILTAINWSGSNKWSYGRKNWSGGIQDETPAPPDTGEAPLSHTIVQIGLTTV